MPNEACLSHVLSTSKDHIKVKELLEKSVTLAYEDNQTESFKERRGDTLRKSFLGVFCLVFYSCIEQS